MRRALWFGCIVPLAFCASLRAQQSPVERSAPERSPLKQSDVPQSSSAPANEPVQSEQRALAQLRTITEVIKKCPPTTAPTDALGDWYIVATRMNVIWDVEQRQSVRSPKIGFIEHTTSYACEPNLSRLPNAEDCKPNDKKCRMRSLEVTVRIFGSEEEQCEQLARKPTQFRIEFDFGPGGLGSARELMKLESEDEGRWSATPLVGMGCVGDEIQAVVDDPLNRDTRPAEIPDVLWKSAKLGSAEATYRIGSSYSTGSGIHQNYAEAVRWYRKAAEMGNADAQLGLASSYFNGKGVTQYHTAAFDWYRAAAEQGNPRGQVMLGTFYGTGEVVPKDDEESYFWLYLAAPALGDDVKKLRDEIGGNLTQAKRLEVQERCRKWAEKHSQNHN